MKVQRSNRDPYFPQVPARFELIKGYLWKAIQDAVLLTNSELSYHCIWCKRCLTAPLPNAVLYEKKGKYDSLEYCFASSSVSLETIFHFAYFPYQDVVSKQQLKRPPCFFDCCSLVDILRCQSSQK